MPIVNTSTRVYNILQRLAPTEDVQLLYTPIAWENEYSDIRGLLKTLSVRSEISSLDAVQVPEFEQPSNQADRYIKTRDMTWTQPRYQLDLCLKKEGLGWYEYVSVSVQNHASIPYMNQALLEYMNDGLAYALAEGTELGIKFQDVGFGLPSANDRVTVFGEVHEEIIVRPRLATSCAPLNWNLNGSKTTVANEDLKRIQLLLVNSGQSMIWVSRSGSAEIGKGLVILPGGSLNIQDYYGEVSAVAEGVGLLSGEVCY